MPSITIGYRGKAILILKFDFKKINKSLIAIEYRRPQRKGFLDQLKVIQNPQCLLIYIENGF